MKYLPMMRPLMAFAIATIALFAAVTQGRAQIEDVLLPPISTAQAQYFRDNPAAWDEFVAQLPRRPATAQPTVNPAATPLGGSWATVTAAPVSGLGNPLLLTDGTVIVHVSVSQSWYKLTPDINGNYATGTWSQIGSLPAGYGPLYFASAVLPDGRVIMQGGEYNLNCTGASQGAWTSLGAIYDPIANTWTNVNPPTGAGWTNTATCGNANGGVGDAQGIVLPNGTFLLGACCANPPVDALFNATSLTYAATGAPSTYQDEQGYALLPTGNVLTIDVWDPPNTQLYNPTTGTWSGGAQTPVSLIDPCGNGEVGPAVTRPDGTTVAFGGYAETTKNCTASPDPTAIYNAANNSWVAGPSVPQALNNSNTSVDFTLADAPAALLPSGNILFAASSGYTTAPTHFFEYPANNSTPFQVADPQFNASNNPAFAYNMLDLPNGQVFVTDGSNVPEVYTPTGTPNAAWAPTVSSMAACVAPNNSYALSGTQLNGLSQGAGYGDDVQAATNFPVVRIVNNNTGHVFYARTSYFSTMSIASGQTGSATVKVASATEAGASTLFAVANGIPSMGTALTVSTACPTITDTHDLNADGRSDVLWRDSSGNIALWMMNGAQITQSGSLGNVGAWSAIGQRDFAGSGNAGILWSDGNGDLSMWLMNGLQVVSATSLGNVATNWTVFGTGDLNGDGKGDLLWRDSVSNTVAIWFMNGSQVASTASLGTVGPSWTIVGDDNRGHVVWRDSGGDVVIWQVSGTQVTKTASLGNVATTWAIAGIGDFNGDGITDLLWRDTVSGTVVIWFMNGTLGVQSTASLGAVGGTWNIRQTGDYNGDGKSDILWVDGSGNVAVWFMNASQVASTASYGNVGTSWSVQGQNAD